MSKKVLLVLNGKKFGGAEKMSLLLAKELSSHDFKVEILLNDSKEKSKFNDYPVEVCSFSEFIGKSNIFKVLYKQFQVVLFFKKKKFDLIIFENKYLLQLISPLLSIIKSKTCAYIHFPPGEYELKKCNYNKLDKIILCSESLRNYFKDCEEISVLNNFVKDNYDQHPQEKNDSFTLLSVGHISPVKNQLLLIKLANLLKTNGQNIKLYLLGANDSGADGYLAECNDMINELDLSETVIMTGYVQNPESYYAQADIYLQPSYSEGLPLASIEALSFALPIIASNTAGFPEIIVDDWNGYLINNYEVDLYLQKVLELINNDQKLKLFSSNSRNKYLEEFTFEQYQKQVKKIFIS